MWFTGIITLLLASTAFSLDNGLGATPPMGWSSWNYFSTHINETVVLDTADAIISTGLHDLGYEYVNIDAGSMTYLRDAAGRIQPDPSKFPHGMKYIADKLHAKGLKLGVYTDLSSHSCGTGPGSKGYYESDASTFASWGVDYLKVDFCGAYNGSMSPKLSKSCAPGALTAGSDLWRANVTKSEAIAWCDRNSTCVGFTTRGAVCNASDAAILDVYFKRTGTKPSGDTQWTHWMKPGTSYVSYQPTEQYAAWKALGDALNASGRPIYFSICPHTPTPDVGTAAEFAGAWLAYAPPPSWTASERHALANSILVEYTNTWDEWYAPPDAKSPVVHGGILTDIDSMVQMTKLEYSVPGSWNDADMLQVCMYGEGNTPHSANGMTLIEYRTHYAVWSILASPLLLGADIRTVGKRHPDCLKMLLNKDIVAVNQDPAGYSPKLIRQRANSSNVTTSTIVEQIFARPLSGNKLAVLLLNRGESTARISVSWSELGLAKNAKLDVRDILQQAAAGTATDTYSANVDPHDCVFIVLG